MFLNALDSLQINFRTMSMLLPVVAILLFVGLQVILSDRKILLFLTRHGSFGALCRLTRKQYRKTDSDTRFEAKEIVGLAEGGDVEAMYKLGLKLGAKNDRHFNTDKKISMMWFKKAARFGHEEAKKLIYSSPESATKVHESDDTPTDDPFAELQGMIGLDSVKTTIKDIADRAELFEKRKKAGLPVTQPSLHMVFMGNPGTGKTTVARIIGRLLKRIGYLTRGHVVEVYEGELIGQYIGETPLEMHGKIQQALGGILFIDEAYSMLNAKGDKTDFAASAIATLVKYMEDLRHDLVVIVAGYPKEMMDFLKSNPGLASRFTEMVQFDDYTPQDLTKIYLTMARAQYYKLDAEAKQALPDLMVAAKNAVTEHFSNGRFARNLFEDSVRYLAARIASSKSDNREDLVTIRLPDIKKAFDKLIEDQKVAASFSGKDSHTAQ